ncbi:hypothetical protein [Flavobacterium sp. GT3R68]|uniref:hypothetical protein n=1 Tax=Flavobacterium sp. GT3R68 TaxID=2594437 RepID=UPI000F895244|nr:hypothetical protein [Flavobacterium sp. GT3R68]RTY93969.1 hypothetical protein EKL32_13895 [Flavobacterium sp. GSN2]TRW93417.1 hypothetical protein FNW07_00490 [Flavobacterium sp. GT3R68]
MKYLNYIAIILLPLLSIAQTETKLLQADIRGRSCAGGLGVCSTSPVSKNSLKNFTVTKISGNTINLTILITDLSPEDQSMLFEKRYPTYQEEILVFHQDEDYAFEKKFLTELGVDINYYQVKKGDYPLRLIKEYAVLTITLSN